MIKAVIVDCRRMQYKKPIGINPIEFLMVETLGIVILGDLAITAFEACAYIFIP